MLYPCGDFLFNDRVCVTVTVIAFIPGAVDVIRQIKPGIVFPGPDYFSVPDGIDDLNVTAHVRTVHEVIQDIAGSSGIFVNDDEIVHRKLCDEDMIYIGSHKFQFINPAATARPDTAPDGPQPATGEMAAPQTKFAGDPAPAAAFADQPEQPDDPPSADADESTTRFTRTADSADASGTSGSTVAIPDQDSGTRGGNIYPYPASTAAGDEEVDDEATCTAVADANPLPAPPPLALVADNRQPDTVGDSANIDNTSSFPLPSDTPYVEEETLAIPEPGGGEPLTTGDAADIQLIVPIEAEQDALMAPVEPGWNVGPAGGQDYRAQPDDDAAGGQAGEDPETAASTADEPAADPAHSGPHLRDMADDATPPVEGAVETREFADFPPFTAGIEVLSGPNSGKRLMFSRSRIVLGRNGGRSVIIERHENEYRVRSADRGAAATVNGTLLLQDPVPLADGDRIEFAELSARFFQRSSISEQS